MIDDRFDENRFDEDEPDAESSRDDERGDVVEKTLKESEEVQEREFFGAARDQTENRSSEHLWLISYSDFMTIMMIFFLAMYGYSHLQKSKADQLVQVDKFSYLATEISHKLDDQVRIVEEQDKITLELGEGILFRSGRADLNAEAARTLAEIGASIRGVEGDIIVEGHTDTVPIVGGPYRSNWELSAARAFSVIQQLKDAGIPEKRLAAWGFGENRPVVDNLTAESRQRNRRIEIVIMKKRSGSA